MKHIHRIYGTYQLPLWISSKTNSNNKRRWNLLIQSKINIQQVTVWPSIGELKQAIEKVDFQVGSTSRTYNTSLYCQHTQFFFVYNHPIYQKGHQDSTA